jgi:hypothetical protein
MAELDKIPNLSKENKYSAWQQTSLKPYIQFFEKNFLKPMQSSMRQEKIRSSGSFVFSVA